MPSLWHRVVNAEFTEKEHKLSMVFIVTRLVFFCLDREHGTRGYSLTSAARVLKIVKN
jgi:hypothetical protein